MPGYSLVKAYLRPDFSLVWVQIGVQGYYEEGRLVCFYVSAIATTPPVIAQRVQPVRADGFARWLSENWHRVLPYVIACLGASYVVYAEWTSSRAESREMKHRIEQLEKGNR